ncbi:MAG: biopolymer transporter ExbD [Methylotenera sp.]|nr:biopolymer transporter ExbD [Oligoflexia bacterium]
MLKRPSSRRKSKHQEVVLNLVPILDAMVTLIGFLLFTMSILNVVSIESPLPQMSAQDVEQKLKEKPLQLTVSFRKDEIEIWSPFDRIQAKKIPNVSPGQPDVKALHEALIVIKQQFTGETKIVVAPEGSTSYDVLISSMDAMRTLEPTDPPIFVKNPQTGIDQPLKVLFPDVIFGNLLGDA